MWRVSQVILPSLIESENNALVAERNKLADMLEQGHRAYNYEVARLQESVRGLAVERSSLVDVAENQRRRIANLQKRVELLQAKLDHSEAEELKQQRRADSLELQVRARNAVKQTSAERAPSVGLTANTVFFDLNAEEHEQKKAADEQAAEDFDFFFSEPSERETNRGQQQQQKPQQKNRSH
jgi:hypothetical protein